MFCFSGFAVSTGADSGICKSVTSITFDGTTLDTPYECDPSDNSVMCNLVYGSGASDYIETQ